MKKLSKHQRGVILRGICNGHALQDKQAKIVENNTAVICEAPLSIWEFCSICNDAEVFNLKPELHYNVATKIVFVEADDSEKSI